MISKVEDYLPGEVEHTYRMPCPNDYLHHYSKIDSILGILSTKCIWLTHFSQINDSSEGRLILERANENTIIPNATYELLLKNYYICCFSNYGNLLSQWRAYGDINIGFDRNFFESGTRLIEDEISENLYASGVQFSDCHYINENDDEFNETIKNVKIRLQEVAKSSDNKDQYNLLSIGLICFPSKHSGFKEEAESRIIAYLYNKKPFKYNGKEYIKYKFNPNQVKRIVIGPSGNKQTNMLKIQEFIENNPEYKGVEIFESGIPFIDV